jgi:hypothetical protein
MKYNRVISSAVLFLLLGTTIPTFAQKGEEEKGGGGGKAQPQHAQKAESQHAQKSETQHAQKAESQHAQKSETQHAEKSESQHAQKAETQHAQRAESQHGQTVANNRGNNGNHYGRISDASYREHFGRGHSFHMGRPEMVGGYNRFHYDGYWFGFNVGWPYGWNYNDDVYVEYVGGGYYMCDLRHPGIRVTLNVF